MKGLKHPFGFLDDEQDREREGYRPDGGELPDETQKDDRHFEFDNPGGVDLPVGITVETWDGAVEIHADGETRLAIHGPHKVTADADDAYIDLAATVDDREHDTAASHVMLSITVSDAQILAGILSELRLEQPEVLLSEDSDADEEDDSA